MLFRSYRTRMIQTGMGTGKEKGESGQEVAVGCYYQSLSKNQLRGLGRMDALSLRREDHDNGSGTDIDIDIIPNTTIYSLVECIPDLTSSHPRPEPMSLITDKNFTKINNSLPEPASPFLMSQT
jgi:hypothetical protein